VAFEHRDELFYDVDAHADSLRRVFALARRPGFHIWTNRFPVSHLEGMEELIQDPHKMLDEVGGRRTQFRRYLDAGEPIDCRDKDRCPHCFIEPFCSTLDRDIARLHAGQFDVFDVGDRWELAAAAPAGMRWIGGEGAPPPGLGRPLRVRADSYVGVSLPDGSRAIAARPEHLEQLQALDMEIELQPDREFAEWLLVHPERITDRCILVAPTHGKAEASARLDPDWRAFFAALPDPVRVAGLPACLCANMRMEAAPRVLPAALFHDDGRVAVDRYVDHYIESEYSAKSLRCRGCPVDSRCGGRHIQALRAHGFVQLQPLSGAWATEAERQLRAFPADPRPRLREGVAPATPPPRVPVAAAPPVPFIDLDRGRRS
jgi:hypothetical protein